MVIPNLKIPKNLQNFSKLVKLGQSWSKWVKVSQVYPNRRKKLVETGETGLNLVRKSQSY